MKIQDWNPQTCFRGQLKVDQSHLPISAPYLNSTVLVEIVLLSLKKETKRKKQTIKNKNKTNKQRLQQHVTAPVYITGEDAIRQLL